MNRLRFKAPEREANRAGKVIFLIFVGGQDLDELGAAFDQLLDLVPVDFSWHTFLAFYSVGLSGMHDLSVVPLLPSGYLQFAPARLSKFDMGQRIALNR